MTSLEAHEEGRNSFREVRVQQAQRKLHVSHMKGSRHDWSLASKQEAWVSDKQLPLKVRLVAKHLTRKDVTQKNKRFLEKIANMQVLGTSNKSLGFLLTSFRQQLTPLSRKAKQICQTGNSELPVRFSTVSLEYDWTACHC